MRADILRRTLVLSVGVSILLAQQPAYAASPCDGVDTQLTKQRKSAYAKLVAESLGHKVKPSNVGIENFIQSGTWTVVYADVPVADPGYFFFDASTGKPEFKDVWGGMADKSEMPGLIKWAKKLGANSKVSACFAATATD